jgi:adenine-specific DNA-methyltransferase
LRLVNEGARLKQNFKEYIEDLFKNSDKFSDSDNKLYTNTILEAIQNMHSDLIQILLDDTKAKEYFFTKVNDIFVLNQIKLIELFTMNNYFEDSYTSSLKYIGLIIKDNFIK